MLHVHRSASADVLVAELAALLAVPGQDPFAAEVVAVPAAGVERWLAQRLSHVLGAGSSGAGICANVAFPSPAGALDDAVAAVSDDPGAGGLWRPERVVWPLLELVDSGYPVPGGAAGSPGRRYAWAARLAGILTRYGHERPELLQAWAHGADDPAGLPDDLRWQPDLWRSLRERIGTPSPAERLPEVLTRLRKDPERIALPDRISVFGLNRLTRYRLLVLAALAEHRDVHLWINHASPALWTSVVAGRPPGQPFLASMSRDVQALQRRLVAVAPDLTDHLHHAPERPDTLLGRLQTALADDAAPAQRAPRASDDDTVAVHACHGRARQVEVLRDVLLHRLEADPTLQPRDVLVMCPDIEAFAPLIAAAFGDTADTGGAAHPAATLRVQLADRAPRASNPLYGTVEALLRLGAGRAGLGAVLDLVETDPVRRRFGLDSDATAQLREWMEQARVSWGYDAEHRERYGLRGVTSGTWRNGLDRLLLGVTMEDTGTWLDDALPLDDVDSTQIELAGRFAELLDRVAAAVEFFATPRPVAQWARGLGPIVSGLALPPAAWQTTALLGDLDELAEQTAGHEVSLDLADFTALWAIRTPARPSRAGFRTGKLTVATMVPMRSVPHRVVVLLGLDDGVFPRADHVDGDDLLARDRRDGERDPRTEDRQLLLDAVCAAREHLVVLHTGADERSGLAVPPAVPLAELLDALDTVAVGATGGSVSAEVMVRHPLQPFDPRSFGGGGAGAFVSFDPVGLAGATAMVGTRLPRAPFVAGALPPVPLGDVELDDLRAMLLHPAKEFLRQRLGVRLAEPAVEPPETLPIELDNLVEWGVGDRLLAARLADREINDCLAAEVRRGVVPPGQLGLDIAKRIGRAAEAVAELARGHLVDEPESIDINVEVRVAGLDRGLRGTVTGVRGAALTRVSFSKLGPKQLLAAWVDLLALTVSRPAHQWQAVVIGRAGQGEAARRVLGPVPVDVASEALIDLIGVADLGRCEPLPLPLKCGHTWATAAGRNLSPDRIAEAAARDWDNKWGGERSDPAHVLVWGPEAAFDSLDLARLAVLAARVWAPFLSATAAGPR